MLHDSVLCICCSVYALVIALFSFGSCVHMLMIPCFFSPRTCCHCVVLFRSARICNMLMVAFCFWSVYHDSVCIFSFLFLILSVCICAHGRSLSSIYHFSVFIVLLLVYVHAHGFVYWLWAGWLQTRTIATTFLSRPGCRFLTGETSSTRHEDPGAPGKPTRVQGEGGSAGSHGPRRNHRQSQVCLSYIVTSPVVDCDVTCRRL